MEIGLGDREAALLLNMCIKFDLFFYFFGWCVTLMPLLGKDKIILFKIF